MSSLSPNDPTAAKDTAPAVDRQPPSSTSENPPTEYKKPPRPSTILHRKVSSKRLVGRLPISPSPTSPASQSGRESVSKATLAAATKQLQQQLEGQSRVTGGANAEEGKMEQLAGQQQDESRKQHRLPSAAGAVTGLLEQLKDWAHAERQRQKVRRGKKAAKQKKQHCASQEMVPTESGLDEEEFGRSISPVSSGDESATAAIDALGAIIEAAEAAEAANMDGHSRRPSAHRRSSRRKSNRPRSLKGGQASDTDHASDGEALVPSCEEVLQMVEEVGMDEFKNQVLKLAHTLRCKGWRRVSLDRYKEIIVERISGALTNAVFMVSAPNELPAVGINDPQSSTVSLGGSMKIPAKLLLRIYGPNVSHLIDRESELSILRRLARKSIGPRLLGTFLNGRFEEFFPSRTLTKDDIRDPGTSRHIAKRLKELHEGIELEEGERQRGPVTWRDWDKWLPRAREIMNIVDNGNQSPLAGCSWEEFENAVARYREWIYARYGGAEGVNKELIFAHNDTQYGNILRLQATGKSPLLLPMNEHRQLVVIDFEYASANTPGFEFANHFCEWMANYHDPDIPYILNESNFPNLGEQRNFLRAYVEHRLAGAYSTRNPSTSTLDLASPSSNLDRSPASFNLDARTPSNQYKEEEAARQCLVEKQVERFIEEARAWRAASHAQWCAWGILQAGVKPEGAKQEELLKKKSQGSGENALSSEAKVAADDMKDKKDEESGFDYLAYSHQRAMLFWGDMLTLGIFKPEEVDEFVLEFAKKVKW